MGNLENSKIRLVTIENKYAIGSCHVKKG